ncbi:carbohydrate binding domain-containing protein [Paenibacillus sp. FSL H8-0034]|uniref:carbohydrate binding domain-containing protein n=1 Tax=Paenibacillus sp. FSL H8-0034 TaxID=2954671 RepID=UPI0030F857EF
MKKSVRFLIIFTVICSLLMPQAWNSQTYAAGETVGNIVQNPGFEDAALSPWLAKPGSPALLEKDTVLKHSGSASGKFTPRDTSYSHLRQELVLKKNVTYAFSAWVRLNPASQGKKYIYIKLDYPTSSDPTYTSGGSGYPKIAVTGTLGSQWVQITGTHTYTGQLEQVNVGMYFETDYNSTNTFNVDDVSVTELLLPASISISGPVRVAVPETGQQTAITYQSTVFNQYGTTAGMETETVNWSLQSAPAQGLAISGAGVLSVSPTVTAGVYTLKATLASDSLVAGYLPVAVGEIPPAALNTAITGRFVIGETLSGHYTYSDPNGDGEQGTTYQWWRSEQPASPLTAIAGASGITDQQTGSLYTLTALDAEKYIRLQIIPRSSAAPSVGEAVYSAPVYISATNTAPTAVHAAVYGVTIPGQLLTGTYEYADPNGDSEGSSVYRWHMADTANGSYSVLEGQNAATLTVATAYSGKYVKFEVTPVDHYGLAGSPVLSQPLEIHYDTRTALYVDPVNGSNTNAGTEMAPFKTIERARDEVRTMNTNMFSDITVYLRGGKYDYSSSYTSRVVPATYENYTIKTSTLTFNAGDSGFNGHKVIYRAYPGEKPVISGGKQITGWTLHDEQKSIYKAFVGTDVDTRQLYVNGERAVRARSELAPAEVTFQPDYGHTTTDTFLAGWSRPQDLEFVYQSHWMQHRIKVDTITAADGFATIRMNPVRWQYAVGTAGPKLYADYHLKYYENAYELLDSEGEWYLNRGTGYVYYKPRAGENMLNVEVIRPVVDELLTLKGASPEQPVHDLVFENLSFQHAGWLRPEFIHGNHANQNNTVRDAGSRLPESAITVQSARNIGFERNEFTHLGSTGLFMKNGIKNSTIRGNTFRDISGSAVNVEEPYTSTPQKATDNPNLLLSHVDIVNNYIDTIGIEYEPASAISVAHGSDLNISFNEIRNIPYTAIHLGWHHEVDQPVVTKNVYIQNNYIDNLMGTGLYDGGAFYSLGRTAGSIDEPAYRITGNYVRDQLNNGGVFFPDNYSNWWLAQNNVIDLNKSPVWQDHGTKNKPLAPLFAHLSRAVMSDNRFIGNYTTTGAINDKGTNNTFAQMHVVPDAIWPSEAVDIIAQAGLQPEYRDLTDPEHYNVVRNSSFETRQDNVWLPVDATFAKTASARFKGVYAAKVNRTAEDGHIQQQIVMQKGMNYELSVRVKLESGSSKQGAIKLGFGPQAIPANEIVTVAEGTVGSDGWTVISGVYSYNGSEVRAEPYVYFEFAAGTGTASYYLDQFEVIEVAEADQAALQAAVLLAQNLHAQAVEGEIIGQYAPGSRLVLQTAVSEADVTANQTGALPNSYYRALDKLSAITFWFIHQQNQQADFNGLHTAISQAQQLYSTTSEGTQPGQYTGEVREALSTAIAAALLVSNAANSTQEAVDSALSALNSAMLGYSYKVISVNEAILQRTISEAVQMHDNASEGADYGEYAAGSKTGLQNAIDSAEDYLQSLNPGSAVSNEMLRDLDRWTSPITPKDGYVEVFGRGVGYERQTFGSDLFELNMQYTYSEGDWPSFAIRSSNPAIAMGTGASSYMIIVKEDVWEVQKWVNGTREMLFGELAGFTPRFGVLPNTQITSGTKHKLKFGAIEVSGSIRLVMYVDDQLVFDEVDSINPLTGPGYFVVYSTTSPMKLSAVNTSQLNTAYITLLQAVEAFEQQRSPALSGISLAGSTAVQAGGSTQLSVSASYNDSTVVNGVTGVTYGSSNVSVATVSAEGTVSTLRAGTSVITAVYGTFHAEYRLTVTPNEP